MKATFATPWHPLIWERAPQRGRHQQCHDDCPRTRRGDHLEAVVGADRCVAAVKGSRASIEAAIEDVKIAMTV